MFTFILKFGLIIFLNLFAFLVLGHILDTLFLTGNKIMIFSLILSIFPLTLIMFYYVGKTKKEFENNLKK